ncbi:MAG: substrate-binding domain-containing protein [Acidobacteria bacterium]|nr:substrate-binding domain-containing protein [Acidobacteriota bacterium]MBI3657267.1 substrate-binding domain-containing protein [Acidobacteriota bacterium]
MPKITIAKKAIESTATLFFFAGLFAYIAWPWLNGFRLKEPPPHTLVVYGFSILQEVMSGRIFPAFQRHYQQKTNKRIQILGSFSGSGTTTNHILMGAPAQVALLSTPGNAARLKQAGLVRTDWASFPFRGVIARTPVVILVRHGNPKGIHDFSDLVRDPIAIIHPDPLTSGGALWAILAEYGSALTRSEAQWGRPDRSAAFLQLEGIWRRITALTGSARGARTQFDSGFGDALVTYEQEAVSDMRLHRFSAELIMPWATIFTEPLAVIVDRNVSEADRPIVNEFVNYLWSDAAQFILVDEGFRSVTHESFNHESPYFQPMAHPFTIADLGGWDRAYDTIIREIWEKQILQELRP